MDATYLGSAGNSFEYLSIRTGSVAAEGSSDGISADVGSLFSRRDRLNGAFDHILICRQISDAVADSGCDWTGYRESSITSEE